MITFTIGSYQIMAFAGSGEPVRVYMNDSTNQYRGYIDFIKDYSSKNKFKVHSNGVINAFMPLENLTPSLGILRNEKPVYFAVNEKHNWAALKTGLEPTGEEETP